MESSTFDKNNWLNWTMDSTTPEEDDLVAQNISACMNSIYDYIDNITMQNGTIDPFVIASICRGPQQQPLEMIIPLTVINIFIFVTGLLGNIAVCVVILKHPALQTATNYYLFNLAVSDLTLLIFGLPYDVSIYWYQYPWTLGDTFCKLRALISETASYVSVLTIVAFSTERYLAICYPLYLHTMSGLQRAVRIITCLWVVAFILALPFAFYTGVDYITVKSNNNSIEIKESAMCMMTSQPQNFPLIEISTIVFFVIPLLIIAVQYTRMGMSISRTARKSLGKSIKGSVHRTNRRVQSNRSVIRMLTFVVVGFFVCWAPFHAQRLVILYFRSNEELNFWIYFITGVFYYFSSTLNPILYNVMSDRMRNAFKEVICGIKPPKKTRANSTIRETSHAYIAIQNSNNTANIYLDDEDKVQLMRKDIIVTTPNMRNKMIFEIYPYKENGDILKIKHETSM